MKSRAHQIAFPLPASIDVHLHGFRDSVVFVEIFGFRHAGEIRIGDCGASTAKRGQSWTRLQWIILSAMRRASSPITRAVLAEDKTTFRSQHLFRPFQMSR